MGCVMRRWGALLLVSAMVMGLMGAASAQGGKRGGTLRAALDGDPPTMDPHRSGSVVDRHVYQSLYDKLVDTDQNLKIVPMLATSWTVGPDGKTVTFSSARTSSFTTERRSTPMRSSTTLSGCRIPSSLRCGGARSGPSKRSRPSIRIRCRSRSNDRTARSSMC